MVEIKHAVLPPGSQMAGNADSLVNLMRVQPAVDNRNNLILLGADKQSPFPADRIARQLHPRRSAA